MTSIHFGPSILACFLCMSIANATDLLSIRSDQVQVGIDREMGGAITWLSSAGYPKNMVNTADPGRLIQQSYYAGRALDRTTEGQSAAWSPWTWNPIQGGGVGASGSGGSWARVPVMERRDDTLYCETIPKLWDMADEEADAVMRQWTRIPEDMPRVVHVRCEFQAKREKGDLWGDAVRRHQEIPACYFTRRFQQVRSYLGEGKWRDEHQPPGPPWGQAQPPLRAMALFDRSGNGIAVYSPEASEPWNFGPHGNGDTDDPSAGPCMHVAPITAASIGYDTVFEYQYWLVVGTESEIVTDLDRLLLTKPAPAHGVE